MKEYLIGATYWCWSLRSNSKQLSPRFYISADAIIPLVSYCDIISSECGECDLSYTEAVTVVQDRQLRRLLARTGAMHLWCVMMMWCLRGQYISEIIVNEIVVGFICITLNYYVFFYVCLKLVAVNCGKFDMVSMLFWVKRQQTTAQLAAVCFCRINLWVDFFYIFVICYKDIYFVGWLIRAFMTVSTYRLNLVNFVFVWFVISDLYYKSIAILCK